MQCRSEYLTISYTPCDAIALGGKSRPTNSAKCRPKQHDNPNTPSWATDEPAHSEQDIRVSHLLYYPLPSQGGLSCCFVPFAGAAPPSTAHWQQLLTDPRCNQQQRDWIDSFAYAEQSLWGALPEVIGPVHR